ncbi:hypothetical protein GOP47_0013836 [Adiantum capillus-veneris]|uniref:Dolichyl-diphosphooligosaccharide--protein glycosyltransferase 48 kDa subunit n=1 Tax=Adiantum capillus-veneris TaxID=13818 RepID=A0A9D4UPJ3_ADICA|nr:hypothetical protein GOP47_0013836 [Adiantum capillus-veneris]
METSMLQLLFVSSLLSLVPLSSCLSLSPLRSPHPRILVLLDDLALKSSHSSFFSSLSDRGYILDYKRASDPSLALKKFGEYFFDGLIVFSPTTEKFGGSVDAASIIDFVDSGRDLILAGDVGMSDVIRDIAYECGVDFEEEPDAVVLDHFNFVSAKSDIDHSLISADSFIASSVILGEAGIQAPVLFHGVAHSVPPANDMVIKVLTGSPTAYSANPRVHSKEPPTLTGSSVGLVSAIQARNNARVVIFGSLALFSNRYFTSPVKKHGGASSYEKSGNEQFVTELSKWVFHERGHLKAVNVHHHRIGETQEPSMYRITDNLEYSMEIYEWSVNGWLPYAGDDVQLQFYMMSPYVLKTLTHNGQGLYSTSFQVPDVYGVFQFKVEYNRLGYTSLSLSKQIPVRPFRHNDYERFIFAAYPYYSSCFSMMFGFFVFGLAFLYHK